LAGLNSKELLAAFKEEGFATVTLDKQAAAQLRHTYRAARAFFDQPATKKNAARLPMDFGYRPFGVEYSQSPERPDLFESFSVNPNLFDGKRHLFVPESRSLYEIVSDTFCWLELIAEDVVVKLAAELSTQSAAERLKGGLRNWSVLQINNGLSGPDNVEFSSESHEDGCLLTLMSNTGGGLEFVNGSNAAPAHLGADEIFVVAGDILHLLSGGAIRPLYHRVCAGGNEGRMALLYFADLDPSLCLPWINSEMNKHIDIGARVRTNSVRHGLQIRHKI
jgi:isopenicillin N synthase-like dioxygenase